jgi:hypothetical protein
MVDDTQRLLEEVAAANAGHARAQAANWRAKHALGAMLCKLYELDSARLVFREGSVFSLEGGVMRVTDGEGISLTLEQGGAMPS